MMLPFREGDGSLFVVFVVFVVLVGARGAGGVGERADVARLVEVAFAHTTTSSVVAARSPTPPTCGSRFVREKGRGGKGCERGDG
ncbi:MAG: hypothetical protein V8S24_11455 [Gordonibacter pamelaeae]